MSTPSLLIVPARLKAGTLFSQIPTNGSGDFTVVQASGNATRVNASGFVELARTNLALRSENLGVIWSLPNLFAFGSGSVLNTTATLDPYGTNVSDLIVANTTLGQHRADQTTTSVSGSYTFSVFLKRAGYEFGRLRIGLDGATFDLVNGVISATDVGIVSSIQSYGNGWYRCIVSKAVSAANEVIRINMLPTATFTDFAGDGTSGIYVFGAQYETGSSASDYIPTTTVARTKFSGVTVDGTVAANIPRLDYYTSNGTPGCPGLLVEASGSNLLQRSEEFENSYWSKSFGNITQDQTTAPNGLTTADKYVVSNGQPPNSPIIRSFSFAINTTYTLSLFVKRADYDTASIRLNTTETGLISNFFNLASGTATNNQIQNYGNGWYRVWVTFTTAATVTNGQVQLIRDADVRDGVAGIFIWGVQLEVGSVATSYIPTTTGIVTRNADVISASGNVSGSIGQTEGSIYAEVNIQKLLGTTQRAFIDIGQTNNRLFLGYGNGITNQIRFLLQTSTGGLVDFQSAATTTGIIRIAVGYKNNDSAMYVNGVSVSPLSNGSFTATLTSLTQLSIGSSFNVGETHFLNDKINAVALYGTRLSNDALMLLSMQGNDAYLPQSIWNFYEDSRAGNTEVPTCLYTRHADLLDV